MLDWSAQSMVAAGLGLELDWLSGDPAPHTKTQLQARPDLAIYGNNFTEHLSRITGWCISDTGTVSAEYKAVIAAVVCVMTIT